MTAGWGRRLALFLVIAAAQFAVLEAGLRWWGGSEASPAFQQIFMQDPRVGHRLRPDTAVRYTTPEFSSWIAINPQGVRDDAPVGPKAPGETRIVILGDSLVLSVQVDLEQWFGRHLQTALNASAPEGRTFRVINAGVQGYGPVDEWLFYKNVVDPLDPDLVLVVTFVGNDAVEAHDKAAWIAADGPPAGTASADAVTAMRRVVRASMVLQNVRVRWDLLMAGFEGPGAERPLTSYLATPPADVVDGLRVSREAIGRIAEMAAAGGARTAIALMPARFQTDDPDYGRLKDIVAASGETLLRDAASERFAEALTPLGLPLVDLLPALRAEPDRLGLFFQRNVHLTPRGHVVVGRALTEFVRPLVMDGR